MAGEEIQKMKIVLRIDPAGEVAVSSDLTARVPFKNTVPVWCDVSITRTNCIVSGYVSGKGPRTFTMIDSHKRTLRNISYNQILIWDNKYFNKNRKIS